MKSCFSPVLTHFPKRQNGFIFSLKVMMEWFYLTISIFNIPQSNNIELKDSFTLRFLEFSGKEVEEWFLSRYFENLRTRKKYGFALLLK